MTDDEQRGTERRRLARNAGLAAAGTLVSRALGMVRDMAIAATFSVASTDAWVVAFTIPNALRALLAEGGVSAAFVPTLVDAREKEGMEGARRFTADFSTTMFFVLMAVAGLGVLAAPWLVKIYAAGFDPARFSAAVTLTRLVFPYLVLVGLAAIVAGALNAADRFFMAALAPAMLNVGLVLATWLLAPRLSGEHAIEALGYGALAGGLLGLVLQIPQFLRTGFAAPPRAAFFSPRVKQAFVLMGPLLAGLGVSQTHVVLVRLFASFLPEGAPTYLYYGARLIEIPQGMFAVAVASATLPRLAALRSRGQTEELARVFRDGLKLTLFIAIPACVLLVAIAEPIVAVVFGRGDFGRTEVVETSRSLVFQALGIVGTALARLYFPAFHAHNDTKSPIASAALGLVCFGATAAALTRPLGHVGIAVAIAVASVAQLGAAALLLRKHTGAIGVGDVLASAGRTTLASLAMGAAAFGIARLGHFERGGNDPLNIGVLALALGVAAVVFVVAAKLLRAPELDVVLRRRR